MLHPRGKAFALVTVVALVLFPAVSSSGPCSGDIADMGRKLTQSASPGLSTAERSSDHILASLNKEAIQHRLQPLGLQAFRLQIESAAWRAQRNGIRPSAKSRHRPRIDAQLQGLPTAARLAAQGSKTSVETTSQKSNAPRSDDRLSEAKVGWQWARTLDQKDDRACSESVKQARDLMRG